MATSFAPSPIDKVDFFGKRYLTMSTISAFCLGETLQARTTSTMSAKFKNSEVRRGVSMMVVRASPETSREYLS